MQLQFRLQVIARPSCDDAGRGFLVRLCKLLTDPPARPRRPVVAVSRRLPRAEHGQ